MVVIDLHTSLGYPDRHPGLGTIASTISAAIGTLSLVATIVSMCIPASEKIRKTLNNRKAKTRSKTGKRRR